MDQGIIKMLKQMFRKLLVCRIIQRMKPGCKPHKLKVLDAMHLLAASWNSIKSTTITNCFKTASFIENATPYPSVVLAVPCVIPSSAWKTFQSTLSVSCSFESYASVDDYVQTHANQDIEDLCAEHEEESEDESDVAVSKPAWLDKTENLDSLKHFLPVHQMFLAIFGAASGTW
ncbi:hypothetical protein PR048_006607 [Dryococelus australis]|uniref:DDE-1 domain-containing protein n=1 Tax=Dryococelus australis TaxID=614101 RepID=A0ABQ9IBE8_9NEOP|nr:hypothetical protein PR048_006607 [Dryococelus australis]